MKIIILIIVSLFLAMVQSIIQIPIGSNVFSLSLIPLVSIPLLLINKDDYGLIFLLAGSLFLDFLSPFRPGWYMISAIIVLIIIKNIKDKSLDFLSPFNNCIATIILLVIYKAFEFFLGPSFNLIIVDILINIALTLIIVPIIIHFLPKQKTVLFDSNV